MTIKKDIDNFAIGLQNIRMWIKRNYETTLAALARQFPAVVVTGARQVGKTSLVRRVFPRHGYLSLDLPAAAEQAENSPAAFLNANPAPLIIDEIQYSPSLLRHLKTRIDADPQPGAHILTGSQNFLSMQGVSESLAGRCGVLTMLNLSVEELLSHSPGAAENDYLTKGGWPELHARVDVEPHFWFAGYLSTYLERDVRNILNVGSLRDFDRFLRAAAIRSGQLLSFAELARDVGIAPNTAKQWISVLEASGQVMLLEPYHRNLGKRLVKTPKLYFCDPGVLLFLLGLDDWEAALRSPLAGALWENHVIMQIKKHYAAAGRTVPLWFYRTSSGSEVDLIIERGGRFIAVEVKLTETPGRSGLKGIDAFRRTYGPNSVMASCIACSTPRQYTLDANTEAVPGSRIARFVMANA